ncbi:MAG: EI24 domain-containing protein [Rhodoglobus sp.]
MAKAKSGGPGRVREFFTGVSLLGRGFGVWRTAPGLMILGLIPALIVAALFSVGIIALGVNLETIAAAVTPFANTWDEPWHTGIRVVVGLAFLAVAVLIVINTFTAVTLIVGQPFYERIWRHVEQRSGGIPTEVSTGFWRSTARGIGDGLWMLAPTLLVGLGIFLLGLIPVVGTILAAVIGAFVGGWYLAIELTGLAFEARGVGLRDRRRTLRSRSALTRGFGVSTYLLFLIPLGAVIVMPAAVAGATLLARRALGQPTDQRG